MKDFRRHKRSSSALQKLPWLSPESSLLQLHLQGPLHGWSSGSLPLTSPGPPPVPEASVGTTGAWPSRLRPLEALPPSWAPVRCSLSCPLCLSSLCLTEVSSGKRTWLGCRGNWKPPPPQPPTRAVAERPWPLPQLRPHRPSQRPVWAAVCLCLCGFQFWVPRRLRAMVQTWEDCFTPVSCLPPSSGAAPWQSRIPSFPRLLPKPSWFLTSTPKSSILLGAVFPIVS